MAAVGKLKIFGPYLTSAGALETPISVYHYAAGTSTLQNVWTDRAKVATGAQPLLSDSTGVASFYADGIYKYVVKDSDANTLYTFDYVDDHGLQVTGEGAALVSASTLILGNAYDYDFFHVTGTTTIAALSGNQGEVTLVFDGACLLDYSSSLLLMGETDYTTVAGDAIIFRNEGSGIWREVSRQNTGGFWRAQYD